MLSEPDARSVNLDLVEKAVIFLNANLAAGTGINSSVVVVTRTFGTREEHKGRTNLLDTAAAVIAQRFA